jgi:hypothetical protein
MWLSTVLVIRFLKLEYLLATLSVNNSNYGGSYFLPNNLYTFSAYLFKKGSY